MLTANDIFRVVVNQRHIPTGQAIVNRYYFRATNILGVIDEADDYANIAAEILLGQHAVVSVYQTEGISYDTATFENVTNQLDVGSFSPASAIVGAVAGASEPLQVALSFKLVRSTRVTRNGSKRFGGIADSLLTTPDGSNLAGTVATVAIEAWLGASIDMVVGDGKELTAVPLIVRETTDGSPPTVTNIIASAQFRGAGSQNSRKQLL